MTCLSTPNCAPTCTPGPTNADWPGVGTSPALLLNRRGQRLSIRGASNIIRAIAAGANLDEEHITAHVGITLIRGGTDLVTVADMLGHARLDTVCPYTHPAPLTANEPSISCHMTADQARWRYYTYLAATRLTRSPAPRLRVDHGRSHR